MSFLLQQDEREQQATLASALAFIDACEFSDSASPATSSTGSSSSSDEEHWSAAESASLRVFIRKTPDGGLATHRYPQSVQRTQAQHTLQQQQQQQTRTPPQPPSLSNLAASHPANVAKAGTGRAPVLKKHRDRKKAERQSLREQVMELETRLARLRLRHPTVHSAASFSPHDLAHIHTALERFQQQAQHQMPKLEVPSGSWRDVAVAQVRARATSEALNATLRETLRRQLLTSKALSGILRGSDSAELRALLGVAMPAAPERALTTPPDQRLIAQLYASVQQLYALTASMFPPSSDADAATSDASCASEMREVAPFAAGAGGRCFEVRTSARAHCSVADAGQLLWQRSSQPSKATMHLGKHGIEKRAMTAGSFSKSYRIALESAAHPGLELHGTSYMHKFDEPARFVFVWTSAVSAVTPTIPASKGALAFTERGWLCATPASGAAAHEPQTIVQTCYQVSSVPSGGNAAAAADGSWPPMNDDAAHLEQLVLSTISRRTCAHQQAMQNELLDAYGARCRLPSPVARS